MSIRMEELSNPGANQTRLSSHGPPPTPKNKPKQASLNIACPGSLCFDRLPSLLAQHVEQFNLPCCSGAGLLLRLLQCLRCREHPRRILPGGQGIPAWGYRGYSGGDVDPGGDFGCHYGIWGKGSGQEVQRFECQAGVFRELAVIPLPTQRKCEC